MSNNELRAQYRTSEGRAKQGFVSPIGEVDEQQLKEMVAGIGVQPQSGAFCGGVGTRDTCVANDCSPWATGDACGITFRPNDMPFC